MQNSQIKTHHLIKQTNFSRLSPEQLIRIVRMDGHGHICSLSAYFADFVSCPWKRLSVTSLQLFYGYMRVPLRGLQRGMSQELLHLTPNPLPRQAYAWRHCAAEHED